MKAKYVQFMTYHDALFEHPVETIQYSQVMQTPRKWLASEIANDSQIFLCPTHVGLFTGNEKKKY
jgi:hypothetical protein